MAETCNPLLSETLTGYVLADCQAIAALDAALATQATRSATMPGAEIDAEAAVIIAALNRRHAAAEKASKALTTGQKKLAQEAIGAAIDIVVESCLLTRNPVCVGSAFGAKIVYDTASFGIQMYDATSGTERAQIAIAFGKDRYAVYKGLIGSLKPTNPAQSAKRVIEKAVRTSRTLAAAGSAVADAKADLEAAVGELDRLNSLYGPALLNQTAFRQFRAAEFESKRFLLQILNGSYVATHCRTEAVPLPLP